jgi:hypothetical protein
MKILERWRKSVSCKGEYVIIIIIIIIIMFMKD